MTVGRSHGPGQLRLRETVVVLYPDHSAVVERLALRDTVTVRVTGEKENEIIPVIAGISGREMSPLELPFLREVKQERE